MKGLVMARQHTPGPWAPYESSERCPLPAGVIVEVGTAADKGAKRGTICEMVAQGRNGKYSHEETDANAQLIAAAPDLLAALEGLLDDHKEIRELAPNAPPSAFAAKLTAALTAIANARGVPLVKPQTGAAAKAVPHA